jgi:hypothetical protein
MKGRGGGVVSNGRNDHRSATAKSAVALPYYRTFSTDHLDQYSSTGKSCWQQDRLAPECGGCPLVIAGYMYYMYMYCYRYR